MSNSLYITNAEQHAGKSLVSMATMNLLLKKIDKVGFFRPIIIRKKDKKKDEHIQLVLNFFKLPQKYEESYGMYLGEAMALMSQGKTDEVIETILRKFKALEEKFHFVLSEGPLAGTTGLEINLHSAIAKNLGGPIFLVGMGHNKSNDQIIQNIKMALENYEDHGLKIMGVLINRVDPSEISVLKDLAQKKLAERVSFLAVYSEDPVLISPTMLEVKKHFKAKVIFSEGNLNNQVFHYSVAAMKMSNYLDRIIEGSMVITPADRSDLIMGLLMAHRSENFPAIAGILLTCGTPSKNIQKLIEGLPNGVPILAIPQDTYSTIRHLEGLHFKLNPDEPEKIDRALSKFETLIDTQALFKSIGEVKSEGLTPMMFEYNLIGKARKNKKHIVLPEGEDPRIIEATKFLVERDIVDITLLGDEKAIHAKMVQMGIYLPNVTVINPLKSPKLEDYTKAYFELRKHKGIGIDLARDLMKDVSYFGTMMVYKGDADGMVSGVAHTTQHTITPALQFVKTKPSVEVVSSVFFMCLESRVLVYGDCAVNPNPDAESLADIAIRSADTAEAFGVEPRIAMLSYSSGESGKGEEVEKVRQATELVKKMRPDLLIEGPIQYDAAVDETVGQKKMPGSKVAGKASVLIFPDLNTGNNTYKAVQRETKALAIGPVLQGLKKPVNDLSRGCLIPDIINTVAITAIQAGLEEEK